ncbi:MAG: NAD(P)-dependent alcohol dehydrogenase [Pyrinomonadaceae bacterium]
MYQVKAYGATAADSPIEALTIPRRGVLASDVKIDILFCGICHSDVHFARAEWDVMAPIYPCVPGHEIVGRVAEVGSDVKGFTVGDVVGVGCLVDSDGTCEACKDGEEQFCANSALTYGSADKHGTAPGTLGGYSESIVVNQRFVLRVPENLELAAVAPLLCAGITTYSPLKHWKVGKGQKVGVVGLGGLGHMAVKFAHAFGAETWVFTTSESKKDDALRLGAHGVILSKDAEDMARHAGSFDFIMDCVSAQHDINAYIAMLKRDGNITLVGAPPEPLSVAAFGLLMGRKSLSGSPIGGIRETQEMLDFCGEHNLTADVEVIGVDGINEAYERVVNSDIKYRFSIDMSTLNN